MNEYDDGELHDADPLVNPDVQIESEIKKKKPSKIRLAFQRILALAGRGEDFHSTKISRARGKILEAEKLKDWDALDESRDILVSTYHEAFNLYYVQMTTSDWLDRIVNAEKMIDFCRQAFDDAIQCAIPELLDLCIEYMKTAQKASELGNPRQLTEHARHSQSEENERHQKTENLAESLYSEVQQDTEAISNVIDSAKKFDEETAQKLLARCLQYDEKRTGRYKDIAVAEHTSRATDLYTTLGSNILLLKLYLEMHQRGGKDLDKFYKLDERKQNQSNNWS